MDHFIIIIIINFINIIVLPQQNFSPSVLTDGLSLEFEWKQVSSSPQHYSQYSGRSQLCCSLDDLHLSSNFQVFQSF